MALKRTESFTFRTVIAFFSPFCFPCLAWGLHPTAAFSLLFLSSISFISFSLSVLISSVFCGVCDLVYRNAALSLARVFFLLYSKQTERAAFPSRHCVTLIIQQTNQELNYTLIQRIGDMQRVATSQSLNNLSYWSIMAKHTI